METIERLANRLAQGLALLGGLGVAALLIHVFTDVVTRNLLGRPIPATNEIASRYYMVAIAFLPLAWVESRDAMVKVELIDFLTARRLRQANEILVAALVAAIYLTLAWVTWHDALSNWAKGTFIDVLGNRIAVWPTYFLPPAGFVLAGLVTLVRIATILRGAR